MKRFALVAALLFAPACETVVPTLGQVLSGIDARRALECAGKEDPKEAAKCLGVTVMDEALRVALDKAAELAEQAREAAGPAGADDMSEEQRGKLAADLDAALGELSSEVAKRQPSG